MPEVAINTPFESNEIKEIAVAEFRKRLDQLGPIQGAKEYVKFALDFNVKIRVWRVGETGAGKETLAWGNTSGNPANPTASDLNAEQESAEITADHFESKDPNTERLDRDMPLTVETTDGRGGRTRKKVKIKR